MSLTVIENIENRLEELFPAERKVADYIIRNFNDVVNMNVSELAKAAEISDATVIRTIKHLGYESYYNMRIELSKDIGKSEIMDESDDTLTSVQKFFAIEAERINRLAASIDFSQLIEIANVILSCPKAHIVSVGNTTPVAVDLGFRLERSGIICDYSSLYEQYINHINLGSKDDCVIAISRSGKSNQVVRAIELAAKKGMKIIGITGAVNNSFTSFADYLIRIKEMSQVSEMYNTDSHLQEIAINDALVYVIKSIRKINETPNVSLDDTDTVGIIYSEFKQL